MKPELPIYDPCPGSNQPTRLHNNLAVCSVCWDLYPVWDGIVANVYKLGARKGTLKPHRLIRASSAGVSAYRERIDDELCPQCETRPPAVEFLPDGGGALAYVHGHAQLWCEICVVEVQLAHARERAAAIPELERQLAELKTGSSLTDTPAKPK